MPRNNKEQLNIKGAYVQAKFTKIRLIAGCWCLLCLVMVNVYNGTLTSYLTRPKNAEPLINKIEDLLIDPQIHLVVDKGKGTDALFSVIRIHIFYKAYKLYTILFFVWMFADRWNWNVQGFGRQITFLL